MAPLSVPGLELEIRDVLERRVLAEAERAALQRIAAILRDARARQGYELSERTVIVLQGRRRAGPVRG